MTVAAADGRGAAPPAQANGHASSSSSSNGAANGAHSTAAASSSSSSSSSDSGSLPRAFCGPTSPASAQLGEQRYVLLPHFTLDSGRVLHNAPVAFRTWGTLAPARDNVLVVCHALTGSADVEDWWGPLLGPGKLFDPTRFFIFCANVLGSPYGSASPCTRHGGEQVRADDSGVLRPAESAAPDGSGWWGPEFPATSTRDDVRIQKLVLDHLGVTQIAAVIGGSMGGMAVLEWPLCFPVRYPRDDQSASGTAEGASSDSQALPYIRAIVPIATAARHSAWCISWAEAQRQSIYSDPAYDHGYYAPTEPPRAGLAAARMAALLTYRSRDSFEARFGRRIGAAKRGGGSRVEGSGVADASHAGNTVDEAAREHNEGNASPHTGARRSISGASVAAQTSLGAAAEQAALSPTADIPTSALPAGVPGAPVAGAFSTAALPSAAPKVFSAQSYLRYQGDKFVKRFDANCYVHLTRKMDMHDVARGRKHWGSSADAAEEDEEEALARVLGVLSHGSRRQGAVPPAVLVVSIESDGLFAPPEQRLLHALIAGSRFVNVRSPDGHDGFLLEFEQINSAVGRFLREELGEDQRGRDLWQGKGAGSDEWASWGKEEVKESVFGEVEDVTRW